MTIHLQIPDSTIKKGTGYVLLLVSSLWFFYVLFTPYYPGNEYFNAVFFPLIIFGANVIFISLIKKTAKGWWVLPVAISFLVLAFSLEALHADFAWDMIFASIANESYRQEIINKYTLQGYRIEIDMKPLRSSLQVTSVIFLETALISLSLSFLFVKLKKLFESRRAKTGSV